MEKTTPTQHCTHLCHHAQLAMTAFYAEKDAVLQLNNNFSLYMIFALKSILTFSNENAL